MKKQKKQSLLTAIIFILVIALVILVGSIIYEEMINMNKQPTTNITAPVTDNDEEDAEGQQENITENNNENNDENQEDIVNDEEPKQEENEYVGQEENNIEDTSKSKDDKAISLAKQEWGEDNSVTFSVEKKKNATYYVAVKSGGVVLTWYEVNTETWEISEY